ncbi:MAG TPA: hypothetical protein VH105_20820, partial [Burkholderiales bacterium]|nr:hypothetical protein [Burkholderiales bacterium]
PELWMKLVELPLDRLAEEPAPETGFARRLMREEKWTYAQAIRVCAEYRRFLLLSQLGPVSPPAMVDAAWHLHLTYTRAYNVGLCQRTLCRVLDHTPSGSARESAHYTAVYEETLSRYREVFGEEPPADIWPPVKPKKVRGKTGNTRRYVTAAIATAFAGVFLLCFTLKHSPPMLFMGAFLLVAAGMSLAFDLEAIPQRRDGPGGGGSCGSCGGGGGCGGCGGCG